MRGIEVKMGASCCCDEREQKTKNPAEELNPRILRTKKQVRAKKGAVESHTDQKGGRPPVSGVVTPMKEQKNHFQPEIIKVHEQTLLDISQDDSGLISGSSAKKQSISTTPRGIK